MTHETLTIHPDRFEDMAQAITNNLVICNLVPNTTEDYDKSIAMIMRTLQHQLWLHRSWGEDLEGSASKFRADRSDAEHEAARAIDG